jgi:hypothetical protein
LKNRTAFIWILRLSSFFVFIGRGWQHFFWDAPYRSILWDERLLTGTVRLLTGMTWDQYATNASVDHGIQTFIKAMGLFYFFCAAASLRIERRHRFETYALGFGSFTLVFLAFLYCKEKSFQAAQFLEFSAQFSAPVLLIAGLRAESERAIGFLSAGLRSAVALTFASHGAYAIGIYPVPGEFVDMTILILKVKNQTALKFLELAGALDFAVAGALIRNFALPAACGYAMFWGIGTSFARIAANVSMASFSYDILQWMPELLYRAPHALLPLALLILARKPQESFLQDRQVSNTSTSIQGASPTP